MKNVTLNICLFFLFVAILSCNKETATPSNQTGEEYEVDAQLTINKITKKVKLSIIKFSFNPDCKDVYLLNVDAAADDFGIAVTNFNVAGGAFDGATDCLKVGLIGAYTVNKEDFAFILKKSTLNKVTKSGKNYTLFCKVDIVNEFPYTESEVSCTWTRP